MVFSLVGKASGGRPYNGGKFDFSALEWRKSLDKDIEIHYTIKAVTIQRQQASVLQTEMGDSGLPRKMMQNNWM